jgi:iron complex transport system substrate-binding protein
MHEMQYARKVRIGAAIAVLVLAVTAFAGCGVSPAAKPAASAPAPKPVTAFPVTITDDASRLVTIDAEPKRIVSLAPANTEIVYALGLFDRLVGVTTYDDYPAEVKKIAKVGDFMAPNLESVAAAKPDVVLVTGGVQADVLGKLEALGAKVVVVDPKNVEGVFAAIGSVSKVLGVTAKGDEVVSGMKSDLADIEKRVASEKPKRAFIEIGWNPLFTAGKGTLLDDLIARAGGVNVVTKPDYVGYSVEQLVKDQPDVYLGTHSSLGDPLALESRPGYTALKCVQAGSIYSLDDNLVSRPGPRVVEGVREIAKVLHPDAFK